MSKFTDWLDSWIAPPECKEERGTEGEQRAKARKEYAQLLESHTQCPWCLAYYPNDRWHNRPPWAWLVVSEDGDHDLKATCPDCEANDKIYAIGADNSLCMCGGPSDPVPVLAPGWYVVLNAVAAGTAFTRDSSEGPTVPAKRRGGAALS